MSANLRPDAALHIRPDATADRREGERRREPSKNALRVQNAELREALRYFVGCALPVSTEIDPKGYTWTICYLDEALPHAIAALAGDQRKVGGELLLGEE